MVRIDGGRFTMGSDEFHPEEMPLRNVEVGPFWIDRHEVTNAQFAAFVEATGYVTVTGRPADPVANPGIDPALLVPGAIVFEAPEGVTDMVDIGQWWRFVPGADWRHPEGPESSIEGRESHPVVHVTREDALAYAHWLGRDLPTEAEWEFAARGGIEGADFVWGDEEVPQGQWQANGWQGVFPVINQVMDGYEATAPVGCFDANGFGLYDMAGNVWEIVKDDYSDRRGPQPGMTVIKGGSYLCSDDFCLRYRPAARQPAALDVGTSHVGFRTVLRTDDVGAVP
ncbi:MAG: formylglycine-generating enzyme family protein [Rhodospirillaceae bacterium]|nr:formylglycine-generating enzyme family protein [Rhodospirillaceae bacterium]